MQVTIVGDDHGDLEVTDGRGVYRVDHQMTPERNLEVQTEIISRAKAFVGTYGGLAYLGPYYGVPSIGFYSEETELVPVHLDMGWRLGNAMHVPLATVDARSANLLQMVLGESGLPAVAAVKLANPR